MEVLDMNGVVIQVGCKALVHQDEGISTCTVYDVFPDYPTVNQEGYWVDIEKDEGEGLELMMSYVLEVVNNG